MKQAGFATTEFLVAIAIAFGLTMLTFALTFTLATVEVTQYIVYSTSRAHLAGNLNPQAQREAATTKYRSLTTSPAFANLFNNGWFEISKPEEIEIRQGNGQNFESDYGIHPRKSSQGVRINFISKLMDMRWPFLGRTGEEDDGFSTRINAILIREVSQQECQDFMKNRPNQINTLGTLGQLRGNGALPVIWEDNGC